jgi:hypothetical protein
MFHCACGRGVPPRVPGGVPTFLSHIGQNLSRNKIAPLASPRDSTLLNLPSGGILFSEYGTRERSVFRKKLLIPDF